MHGADEETVAVGLHLGRLRGADRAAGPALVVDEDLAAELLADLRRQRTGEESVPPPAGNGLIQVIVAGGQPCCARAMAGAASDAARPSLRARRREVVDVNVMVLVLPDMSSSLSFIVSSTRLLLGMQVPRPAGHVAQCRRGRQGLRSWIDVQPRPDPTWRRLRLERNRGHAGAC